MIYVDLAIKSVLAGILGWMAASLLRRSSASTRHTAAFIALIGVGLLPALALLLPQWHVPFIRLTAPSSPALSPGVGSLTAPDLPIHPSVVHRSLDLGIVMASLWLGIAAVLCAATVFRLLKLRTAERRLPMFVDPVVQAVVTDRCLQASRHVLLLEGDAGHAPMTWGHSRPVLLLPSDARSWPEDRINSVVLHELAHIERADWIAGILAQLLCAVYWFNPFTWLIRKRMLLESEAAADDRVLNMGVPATQYASDLLGVTRELRSARMSADVALAMARPGNLDRRVRAILEGTRCRRTVRGGVALGLAALVTAIVGLVGAAAPTIVHEQQKPAPLAVLPPDVSISSQTVASTEGDDKPKYINKDEWNAPTTTATGGSDQSATEQTDSPDPATAATGDAATNSETQDDASSADTETPCVPAAPQLKRPEIRPHGPLPMTRPQPLAINSDPQSASAPVAEVRIAPQGIPDSTTFDQSDRHMAHRRRDRSLQAADVEMRDLEANLKKAGVEIDAATSEAMKRFPSVNIDVGSILNAVGQGTERTTRAAIELARRVAKEQLRGAMKHWRQSVRDHSPPDSDEN